MRIIFIGAIWCSSCLVMKSRLKVLLKEHPEINVINYDFDDESEKIKPYKIGSILPVIIFENNNSEVFRIVGEKTKRDFMAIFKDMNI